MRKTRPVDTITFGFLLFLLITTIIHFRRIPNASSIILIYSGLISVLSLLIYFKEKHNGKTLRILYDLIFPVIAVLFIFDSLGELIQYINPVTYDDLLIRLDYTIFNVHPTVALEKITMPVITEILQLAYTSYYFLPIILGVALKIKGKSSEFDRTLFLIILCFFLSYVGYIFVPAVGPRYTISHLQNIELHGIFLRDSINNILNNLEGIKMDAFPSGHTAITLVVLYLSYKFHRLLFWIFLPFVMGLLISTVYLHYHYVVDVLAGVLLFFFTIYSGGKYYKWWEKSGNAKVF